MDTTQIMDSKRRAELTMSCLADAFNVPRRELTPEEELQRKKRSIANHFRDDIPPTTNFKASDFVGDVDKYEQEIMALGDDIATEFVRQKELVRIQFILHFTKKW